MAGQKRQCANCRYYQDSSLAGNGWCTHPKRQFSSDVKILVRRGELACRNSWGGDLFQSVDDDDQQTDSPDSFPVASSASTSVPIEDEVTSVVTPPTRLPSSADDEDRVVSDRPAPRPKDVKSDDDGHNDAARHDQDERAKVMARGTQAALRYARERHLHRLSRVAESVEGTDTDDDPPRSQAQGESSSEPGMPDPTDQFPQHSSDSPRQTPFTLGKRYEKRRRNFGFVDGPVPRDEVERHHPIGDADRFDSIPEPDPDFALPSWRDRPDLGPDKDDGNAATIEDDSDSVLPEKTTQTAYGHVMERARRIRESRRASLSRPHQKRVPASKDQGDPLFSKDSRGVASHRRDSEDARFAPSEGRENVDRHVSQYVRTNGRQSDSHFHSGARNRSDSEPSIGSYARFHGSARPSSMNQEAEEAHSRMYTEDTAETTAETFEGSGESLLSVTCVSPVTQSPHPHESLIFEDNTDDHGDAQTPRGFNTDKQRSGRRRDVEESARADRSAEAVDTAEHSEEEEETAQYPGFTFDEFHRADRHLAKADDRLPDIDENLFSETFDRSSSRRRTRVDVLRQTHNRADEADEREREADTASLHNAHRTLSGIESPRDNLFRSGRFRALEQHSSGSEHTTSASTDYRRYVPHDEYRDSSGDDPILKNEVEEDVSRSERVFRREELIDTSIQIAPDIPRACRTCRSFRSADGGSRGWCTNAWAFTHRRMVNEHNLACRTSIGCWWLPADRYWIIEDDEAFAAATPRMDELIASDAPAPKHKVYGD